MGIANHPKHNKNKALAALTTLRRFSALPPNIKLHLVKACVLPILTYPPYPLNPLSKTSMLSLQKIQNKALRFAFNERYPYTRNTEQLHQLAKLDPVNVTLFNRGISTKERLLNIIKDQTYQEILRGNINNEHGWFKKTIIYLNKGRPTPMYTR